MTVALKLARFANDDEPPAKPVAPDKTDGWARSRTDLNPLISALTRAVNRQAQGEAPGSDSARRS